MGYVRQEPKLNFVSFPLPRIGQDAANLIGTMVERTSQQGGGVLATIIGIVTRFQYRLSPVGEVLGGALFLPPTRDVLRSLVPIADGAPEELTTISMLMPIPPVPFVAAEHHGKLSLVLMFVYAVKLSRSKRFHRGLAAWSAALLSASRAA